MSSFLLGGRLGDLLHALYVVKQTPGKHDLFITDRRSLHSDGFLLSLYETYKELAPIILTQSWCNSFQIYKDEECINLSLWRRYAYSASWTQLLANTFKVPAVGGPWIEVSKLNGWQDKIIIHCSVYPARRGHWDMLLDKYEGQTIFVGTKEEYESFGYPMPFYKPTSLPDHFLVINSCKFFIGNQSAPLAIAHALDVPRLGVLNDVDKIHYMGEEIFYKNFYWITKEAHCFEGINY